jgi:hypothetical protein
MNAGAIVENPSEPIRAQFHENDIGIVMVSIMPGAAASMLFSAAIRAGLTADGLRVEGEGSVFGPFWLLWLATVPDRKAGLRSLHRTASALGILNLCEIAWFDAEGFWRSEGFGLFKHILDVADFSHARAELESLREGIELKIREMEGGL